MAYKALDIAKHVIIYASENGNEITNLRLQKILYYIQGYFFKNFDVEAFSEDIYNWTYGPVVEDVYYEYNKFVGSPIILDDFKDGINLKNKELKLIDSIIDICYQFKPFELVKKTHEEDPWKDSEKSLVIDKNHIHEYFKNNNPLKISQC